MPADEPDDAAPKPHAATAAELVVPPDAAERAQPCRRRPTLSRLPYRYRRRRTSRSWPSIGRSPTCLAVCRSSSRECRRRSSQDAAGKLGFFDARAARIDLHQVQIDRGADERQKHGRQGDRQDHFEQRKAGMRGAISWSWPPLPPVVEDEPLERGRDRSCSTCCCRRPSSGGT